jgi:hypothetical protein
MKPASMTQLFRVTSMAVMLAAVAASAQTAKNTLSTEEAASGYQLLFNGTDMTGWRGWNTTTTPNTWAVVAESTWNVIRNGSGSAGNVALVTNDSTFQNFDFKYEYWIPAKGNAGVFIRYNQHNKRDWGGCCGSETQIAALDNSDGTNTLHRNGTCYDMFGLRSDALNWDKIRGSKNDSVYHQFRIVAYNNRVAHYGNGIKLLEYDMTSSAYNSAYLASKYATEPIYKTVHQGSLYLQHHGETGIRFRNLRIKKLTQSPWAQGSAYLANPADSTGGLKLTMTHDENFFPTTGIIGTSGPRVEARLFRDGAGAELILDRAGDFSVRVDDMTGRNVFKGAIRGADRITLPASAFSPATSVLRVTSLDGRTEVWRQLIAPVR